MKTTDALLGGIFAALIFIGLHKPSPIVLPAPTPPAQKWEYTVQSCNDDSSEMYDYAKTHPNTNPSDFQNEFGLVKIKPDGTAGATDWELCAWFMEPKEHPHLILIFKRPVR